MHHSTYVVVERRDGKSDMPHCATQVDLGKGKSSALQCHHIDAKGTGIREISTKIIACRGGEGIEVVERYVSRQYVALNSLSSKKIARICSINGLE